MDLTCSETTWLFLCYWYWMKLFCASELFSWRHPCVLQGLTWVRTQAGWNCSAFRYIKKIKPIEVENDLFKFDFSNFFIHLSYPSHKSQTFLPKAASELVGIIKGRGCKKGPEKRTLLILSASKMHWVSWYQWYRANSNLNEALWFVIPMGNGQGFRRRL